MRDLEQGNRRTKAQAPLGANGLWASAALAIAVVTPLLAYIANLGLAVTTALAGLVCLAAVKSPRSWPWGLWALVGLLAWALLSYLWSPLGPALADARTLKKPDTITGLKLALELGLYGAFAAAMSRLDPRQARRALDWLTISLAALLVLLVIEALSDVFIYRHLRLLAHMHIREDFPIHRVARGCYVAAALLWPVAFALVRQGLGWAAAAFWGLTLLCCLLLRVDSPVAAMAAATGAAVLVRFGKAWGVWACGAAVVVYLSLAPLIAFIGTQEVSAGGLSTVGKASWGARAVLWRFVAQEIAGKPIFGWGLDASRAWPKDIPLHPHDGALQIWLELGAIGVVLAIAFAVWLFGRLARLAKRDAEAAAAGVAAAIAYVMIGALSFGIWQEWWLATGAVVAGAVLWFSRSQPPSTRPSPGLPAASADAAAVTPYFAEARPS